MPYQLIYTTIDAIANMLPHLLFEGSVQILDEARDSYGKIVVPLSLVLDIAWQEESEITRILGQIYVTPLQLTVDATRAVLAKLANHLIAAEIKRRLMEQNPVPDLGANTASGSSSNEAIAKNLLLTYTVGHNIIVPGLGAPPQGLEPMQPVFLEGETARTKTPDTVVERRISFGSFANAPTQPKAVNYLVDTSIPGQEPIITTTPYFDIYG